MSSASVPFPKPPLLPSNCSKRKISPSLLATKSTPDECWITYRRVVYDATSWLARHPGGMRTILSNSGRDATAVLLAMHKPRTLEDALRKMRKVGWLDVARRQDCSREDEEEKEETEGGLVSPSSLDEELLRKREERAKGLEQDFLLLDKFLIREGWYEAWPGRYWLAVMRALFILAVGIGLTLHSSSEHNFASSGGSPVCYSALVVGSSLIGMFFQQVAFFGHDAGHGSITGNYRWDGLLGLIVGNALAGIDISWWKSTHNVHHGATNSMQDDPDIQHLPIFCFEEEMANGGEKIWDREEQEGMWSTYHSRFMSVGATGRYLMQFQHLYFYPVMAFARFNLYVQSILHLVRICPFWTGTGMAAPTRPTRTTTSIHAQTLPGNNKTPYDWPTAKPAMWTAQVVSICIFYILWYALLSSLNNATSAAICLAVSHTVAGVLHVQILLSHIAMHYHDHMTGDTSKDVWVEGVGFHELQALTTMDIACHPSMDWLHGGLQFQLEHHIFPRVPKFRLRRLVSLVDEIFARHGVPVVRKGFVEANCMVLQHMAKVGKNVACVKRN